VHSPSGQSGTRLAEIWLRLDDKKWLDRGVLAERVSTGVQRHVAIVAEFAPWDPQPLAGADLHGCVGLQVGQLAGARAGAGQQFVDVARVATCFRQDAIKNVLIEGAWKSRTQEGACVRCAETFDGKARETVEIPRDGSSAEQERNVFRPQPTSRDGECLS
jgi:hypothetical protein